MVTFSANASAQVIDKDHRRLSFDSSNTVIYQTPGLLKNIYEPHQFCWKLALEMFPPYPLLKTRRRVSVTVCATSY